MQLPRRTVDLRSANRQAVLRYLYFERPMSRLELSQYSGLSPATVSNVVAELLKEEIVIEMGLAESEGGRPRTILAVNPAYGYFVGVDLGETHVQMELFDLALNKQRSVRTLVSPTQTSPEQYVELIQAGLNELRDLEGPKLAKLLGIGIGVPGMVERSGPQLVSSPIWKWQSVAFGDLLRSKISVPIRIDNGAKAMTLAEAWFGAGRNLQNLIAVLVGTGVGAGIISGGNLYRGPSNSAGEFGHTIMALNGRDCRCGSQGCLETYIGAPGIIATLRDIAPHSPLLAATSELAVLDNLVRATKQGDATAIQTLHITAHYLGAGIANLVNLFNPEMIVLGGWVGLLVGDTILDDLRQYLERYVLPLSRNTVRIDLCQLGLDAICNGAACLVLDELLSENPLFRRREGQ